MYPPLPSWQGQKWYESLEPGTGRKHCTYVACLSEPGVGTKKNLTSFLCRFFAKLCRGRIRQDEQKSVQLYCLVWISNDVICLSLFFWILFARSLPHCLPRNSVQRGGNNGTNEWKREIRVTTWNSLERNAHSSLVSVSLFGGSFDAPHKFCPKDWTDCRRGYDCHIPICWPSSQWIVVGVWLSGKALKQNFCYFYNSHFEIKGIFRARNTDEWFSLRTRIC